MRVCNYSPEGSLRCESVAKSSAVSNNGGFRKGGRPSLPSLISFAVVFRIISCTGKGDELGRRHSAQAYLSAFIEKDEFDGVICTLGERGNLCRDPGLIPVLKPNPSSLAVNVFGHWPEGDARKIKCKCRP